MELRVLEYYLMVAREENITKAAELLHITQPTLSRQMMQLEEELGVNLFKRGKHKILLTDDGLLLKRRAQEMLERMLLVSPLPIAISPVSSSPDRSKSRLVLFARFLGNVAARFRRQYPLVTFDLYSFTADEVKDRIEKGLIDIGLLTEPVEVGRYGFIRIPRKERWGIMVPKESPLAEKEGIRPEELIGMPLFISKREKVRNEVANWFGDCFDRLTILGTYSLLYNAVVMAEALGGAVLCFYHGSHYGNHVFVPLEPVLETGSVVVWKKNYVSSPAAGKFVEYIKKYAESRF